MSAGRYDRLHGDEDMIDDLDTDRVLAKLEDLRERRADELSRMTHTELLKSLNPYDIESAFYSLLRIWLHGVIEKKIDHSFHISWCRWLATNDIMIDEAERAVIEDMQEENRK